MRLFAQIFNKILDQVEVLYKTVVPWEYRPAQLWDRFVCWAWYRRTTVKPRFLPHTWCDRSQILPHVMFEVLCQFVEQEILNFSTVQVDWSGTPEHEFAKKEMDELYEWWNKIYIPWLEADAKYDPEIESPHFEVTLDGHHRFAYSSPQARELARVAHSRQAALEARMAQDLKDNCKRLVDIMDFLWT